MRPSGMARRSRHWKEGLAQDLRDQRFAREFLPAAIDEGVPLQVALAKVIRAMARDEPRRPGRAKSLRSAVTPAEAATFSCLKWSSYCASGTCLADAAGTSSVVGCSRRSQSRGCSQPRQRSNGPRRANMRRSRHRSEVDQGGRRRLAASNAVRSTSILVRRTDKCAGES